MKTIRYSKELDYSDDLVFDLMFPEISLEVSVLLWTDMFSMQNT